MTCSRPCHEISVMTRRRPAVAAGDAGVDCSSSCSVLAAAGHMTRYMITRMYADLRGQRIPQRDQRDHE